MRLKKIVIFSPKTEPQPGMFYKNQGALRNVKPNWTETEPDFKTILTETEPEPETRFFTSRTKEPNRVSNRTELFPD